MQQNVFPICEYLEILRLFMLILTHKNNFTPRIGRCKVGEIESMSSHAFIID